MPLPRIVNDSFEPEVRAQRTEILRNASVTPIRVSPDEFLGQFNGADGDWAVSVRVNRVRRVMSTFCSCRNARRLHHRCAHVLAILDAADQLGSFRVPADIRIVVPRCSEHDDQMTADALMHEIVSVLEGDEDEDDDLDGDVGGDAGADVGGNAQRPSVPGSTSAAGRHGSPKAERPRPDPLDALDHKWRVALLRMPTDTPPPKHRPAQLLYRLVCPPLPDAWWRFAVEVRTMGKSSDGGIAVAATFNANRGTLERLGEEDRELMTMLLGASDGRRLDTGIFEILPEHTTTLVPRLLRTGRTAIAPPEAFETLYGRVRLRSKDWAFSPARWDDGPPWRPQLEVRSSKKPELLEVRCVLARGDERTGIDAALMALPEGLIIFRDHAARLDVGDARAWLRELRSEPLVVPMRSVQSLLESLASRRDLPEIVVAPELGQRVGIQRAHEPPRPHLHVGQRVGTSKALAARADLRVGALGLPVGGGGRVAIDATAGRILVRDHEADQQAVSDLRSAGLELSPGLDDGELRIPMLRLVDVVRALGERGWSIEAEGNSLRLPGAMRASVRWGIDWFDVEGAVEFGDSRVPLTTLFEAIRAKRGVITLVDGSIGLIPQEWMSRLGIMARSGEGRTDGAGGGSTRFSPMQLLLVEAALGEESLDIDAATTHVRNRMRDFGGIAALDAPSTFTGTLRPYQQQGLGWMAFLREFGFGGCLADDMGLGKTVQVLAMLEARRLERAASVSAKPASRKAVAREKTVTVAASAATSGVESPNGANAAATSVGATLVVAPRSLIYNWAKEAARFAPSLRVLDLSGTERTIDPATIAAHDLVLTTYGLLRRDIVSLRQLEFDYAILDEAQAIKNSASQTAKAAKLLRARHRLALSGTPVENHLGELWSLIEFLNPAFLPGIAGRAGTALDDPGAAAVAASAVRPFILRRTKAQVATELPDRIEQTIVVALEAGQRNLYDQLLAEVRASVLGRVDELGMNRAGVYVLEGLLRLRQAACHPGLVDPARSGEPSAKLDSLVPTLRELADEGHKAIVFSQFTTLLNLVEPRLKEAGLTWERLDGRTRNRQERVERFQSDATCPVFLVSLKAGGVGLNLTAADHVVLLDPWWNPAVEAQAIDRAHRMGQHRTVIATRLIAANTVEQRILELQDRKRALADAIVGGAHGPLAALSRDDLELLLG